MLVKPKNMIDENDPRVSQFGHPAPPWLVNYADLMTELVCFFIILYALSAVLSKDIQNAKSALDELIEKENLAAQTKLTKEGVRFTLQEKEGDAYFQIGKADLTPRMIGLLDKLATVFNKIPNEIVVEGHTDNVPIYSQIFPSNWELSTARATNVVRYLVDKHNTTPERISAVGYGEHRPTAPNDTPENRSKNRRVVFFIKSAPPKKESAEEPASKAGHLIETELGQETTAPEAPAAAETKPETKPEAAPVETVTAPEPSAPAATAETPAAAPAAAAPLAPAEAIPATPAAE